VSLHTNVKGLLKRDVLRGRSKVGIVHTRGILNAHLDTIAPATTSTASRADLEVELILGEAVAVGDIVHGVEDVERIRDRSCLVLRDGGVEAVVVPVYEKDRSEIHLPV